LGAVGKGNSDAKGDGGMEALTAFLLLLALIAVVLIEHRVSRVQKAALEANKLAGQMTTQLNFVIKHLVELNQILKGTSAKQT
jgi:hypothetical protein